MMEIQTVHPLEVIMGKAEMPKILVLDMNRIHPVFSI